MSSDIELVTWWIVTEIHAKAVCSNVYIVVLTCTYMDTKPNYVRFRLLHVYEIPTYLHRMFCKDNEV